MIETTPERAIQTVAMIGVGRMGGPMARNLVRAGFAVRAYDPSAAALQAAAEDGVTPASSTHDAAAGADVVITMLPSDDALQEAVGGPSGILTVMKSGQILIDMSTSKPTTVQRLAERAAAQGIAMLDAPVSGGTSGAQNGTLSIMVGGDPAVFERCRPVLSALGTTLTYIGGHGMGGIAKLVNQMLMEASFCAVAEAFALAAKAGADLDAVYAAVRDGHGGSRVLDQMLPAILSGDFGSGRELTLHHKDGAYALATANDLGAWTPITQLTHDLFDEAMQSGQGDRSASAVVRVYAERMGVKVGKA